MNTLISQSPKYTVIEKTAFELATTWYEVGKSQGLTSKYPDHKSFARANFQKFMKTAIDILIGMLGRQDLPDLMKAEIWEALQERMNDPGVNEILPDVDINKVIAQLPPKPIEITTSKKKSVKEQFMDTANPFLKVN